MIRVNLLEGAADTRAQVRATKAAAKTTQQLIMVGGALLLLLAVVAVDYWISNSRLEDANAQLAHEQQVAAQLKSDREKLEALQAQIKSLQERIKVIDDLSKQQTGPSQLLNLINERLPRNGDIVLERVTVSGNSLGLSGTAKSEQVVSDFARSLELGANGLFSGVAFNTARREVSVPDDPTNPAAGSHIEALFDFNISATYTPTQAGEGEKK